MEAPIEREQTAPEPDLEEIGRIPRPGRNRNQIGGLQGAQDFEELEKGWIRDTPLEAPRRPLEGIPWPTPTE
jgi:hypothetical protein